MKKLANTLIFATIAIIVYQVFSLITVEILCLFSNNNFPILFTTEDFARFQYIFILLIATLKYHSINIKDILITFILFFIFFTWYRISGVSGNVLTITTATACSNTLFSFLLFLVVSKKNINLLK